ncbi:hypothetical protein AAMO2058_001516800 [Amorphochlora amoebiformis]
MHGFVRRVFTGAIFAGGGSIMVWSVGCRMGGKSAFADQKEKRAWMGDGPTYYGGEWAQNFFLGGLEGQEKGKEDVKAHMVELTTQLQSRIIERLEQMEAVAWRNQDAFRHHKPVSFRVDVDDRKNMGKLGITACMQGGAMSNNHQDLKKAIEKGGVEGLKMWVNGISCIVHPTNPRAPTVHFNYRHFQITNTDNQVVAWWFGGGQDLTPIYLYHEDAVLVHKNLKQACDKHNKNYYPKFKAWADKYFYHTARKEARGIGGIFFDDLDEGNPEEVFQFVKECADAFEPSYFPILHNRSKEKYGSREREWQRIRHGRYVEFNLVYDRGTKFGFSVPGVNIEAVLMSLPLSVQYMYKHRPPPHSEEARLLTVLTSEPINWAVDPY